MAIPRVGGIPAPSYRVEGTAEDFEILDGKHGGIKVLLYDHEGNPLFTADNPAMVQVAEMAIQEQKTQDDAVGGVVTFAEPVTRVGIFNADTSNTGVFNVNGINISVPPETAFEAVIGGVPSASVTVTGATSYIITRYA